MIKRRSKPRRVSVARDPKYRAFLREEGWCSVGFTHKLYFHSGPIDPAHGRINGASSKGSDLEAIPLCRKHHDEMEQLRWPAFCEKYNLDRPALVSYWNQRYREESQ